MKRVDRKSDCAINFSLEAFGDPWSLLIVRDMVFYHKATFGEFMASDERIGTNTLSRRLADLESQGIITKHPSKIDKRKDRYMLTDKGLALVPILVALTEWGAAYDPHTGASPDHVEAMQTDRTAFIKATQAEALQAYEPALK